MFSLTDICSTVAAAVVLFDWFLVTLECTYKTINPLYHCRHSAESRQYVCDME